ncbi:P-loop containing nucleoside triphosphate hydrolase protein [Lipomyces japonicus]|uniref:P-loop containing nucleoside triphosphate hydrolase protein n=1 Tax=Lipomyces japonicus TaxID=56871 RepID=UPI0034CE3B17
MADEKKAKNTDPVTAALKLHKKFKSALKNEQEFEVAQTQQQISSLAPKVLARKGLAILNLVVANIRTGLGGGAIVELEPDAAVTTVIDKTTGIRVGDIVAIENIPSATEKRKNVQSVRAEGVVTRISGTTVHVSIDERYADQTVQLTGRLWIVKLVDSVTYKRMNETLDALSKLTSPTNLQRIMLGVEEPTIGISKEVVFFDDTLNQSQKEAVNFAISSSEVSIVHGPPGTGKTYTIIEIIRQLVSRGERVLVCGPSNIAVDTILERLDGVIPPSGLLRVGHPARILQSTQRHSLDIILKSSDAGQIARDVRNEIDNSFAKIKKTKSGRERSAIYQDIKHLRKEYKVREKKALAEVVQSGVVVVCTLHGAGSQFLTGVQFNTVIIDEVSQSLEPQCWIPIINHPEVKKVVIAGDNKQLPPTIKATGNEKILGTTLFDRLVSIHGDKIKRLLNVQYRMNTDIMEYPSAALYNGKLIAADSVKDRVLAELEYVVENEDSSTRVLWIDTQGGEFIEDVNDKDNNDLSSRSNDLEAWIVVQYVGDLLEAGVKREDLGIISPYSAQASLISKRLEKCFAANEEEKSIIEVSTVDGFQGREKNAIIISLVRSNDKGEVGFLKEDRRLNVAITRPRRHLCIVGDMETMERGTKFLKKWAEWAMEKAEIRYPNVDEVLEFSMRQI